MTDLTAKPGYGWVPDHPDIRDFRWESEKVQDAAKGRKITKGPKATLPASVDLRPWCAPIENQGSLGSCTAHAGVGLLEYFERRASGEHIDASRLFLYKVTRNLMGWTGDTGAYLRSTMGAMALFGIPPEKYWPYKQGDFEKEPPAFCYAFAENYKAIKYFRLDPAGTTPDVLLKSIKSYLNAGFPSMFGFTVYNSIDQADSTGRIPYPSSKDKRDGGHAIVAVGYDDKMKIKNISSGSKETVGAFLIRNSWGASWGEKGYGWLPYKYVESELADDWWTLIKNEWIKTGVFGFE